MDDAGENDAGDAQIGGPGVLGSSQHHGRGHGGQVRGLRRHAILGLRQHAVLAMEVHPLTLPLVLNRVAEVHPFG